MTIEVSSRDTSFSEANGVIAAVTSESNAAADSAVMSSLENPFCERIIST